MGRRAAGWPWRSICSPTRWRWSDSTASTVRAPRRPGQPTTRHRDRARADRRRQGAAAERHRARSRAPSRHDRRRMPRPRRSASVGRLQPARAARAGRPGRSLSRPRHAPRADRRRPRCCRATSRPTRRRGRRCVEQARGVGALSHPNVTTLFDVGEHDGRRLPGVRVPERPVAAGRDGRAADERAPRGGAGDSDRRCRGRRARRRLRARRAEPRLRRRSPPRATPRFRRSSWPSRSGFDRAPATAGCSTTTRRRRRAAAAAGRSLGHLLDGRDPLRDADRAPAVAQGRRGAERERTRTCRRSSTTCSSEGGGAEPRSAVSELADAGGGAARTGRARSTRASRADDERRSMPATPSRARRLRAADRRRCWCWRRCVWWWLTRSSGSRPAAW